MHPLLGRAAWLGIYIGAWSLPAALLAALLVMQGDVSWGAALAFAAPMAVVKAFLVLAAWYVCGIAPLRRADPWRIVTTQGGAAAASSVLWVLIGGAWGRALARQAPGFVSAEYFARQAPTLFAVGVLLYLLSAAGHYLYLAFEQSRRAESRAL